MKPFIHGATPYCLVLTFCLLIIPKTFACTIVSAIAKNGHVWNANNEDGPFGVANFINVYPKTSQNKYGYYTLTYFSPRFGQTGSIQGGTNEAGLTFDFNAIDAVNTSGVSSKKSFPKGDNAILTHILGTMHSVEEVIAFFETYWFENGFTGAQMHVADAQGNFAMISPSGIERALQGQPLVSTNFDLCGKVDGTSCWRYPIAQTMLEKEEVGFETMEEILQKTAQKNGATMYSNIQNLTTGELWFFSKHDPGNIVTITIKALLQKGQYSYSFSDLDTIRKPQDITQFQEPSPVSLSKEAQQKFEGTYSNWYFGSINVTYQEVGLTVRFPDGFETVLIPSETDTFFIPNQGVIITFGRDADTEKKTLSLTENGFWSFTAWEKDVSK